MKNIKLKTQLEKYLSKTASPAEVYIIESWYESFVNDPEECDSFKNPRVLKTIQKEILTKSLEKDLRKKAFVYTIKPVKLVASVLLAIAIAIFIQQVNNDSKPLTIQTKINGSHLKSKNREVLSKKYNKLLGSSRFIDESLDVCEIIDKKYRKEGGNIIIY